MAGCLAVCVGVVGVLAGLMAFLGSPILGLAIWFVTLIVCSLLDSAGSVGKLKQEVQRGRVTQERLLREAGMTDEEKRAVRAERERERLRAEAERERRRRENREAFAVGSRVVVVLAGIAAIGAAVYWGLRSEGLLDQRPAHAAQRAPLPASAP